MSKLYDGDVVAWALEQAALLRGGMLERIDALNIAEEIEAVARSEQRELASRFGVLVCHLLKWQFQPARRSQSWQRTIRDQRAAIARRLAKMPSLQPLLDDEEWLADAFNDAVHLASEQTGILEFPDSCPWTVEQILDTDFLPG
ncbi:DUF29 domain-containing protein [Massilia sp. GCM10020059]|uniref:DUF29 domain-containing protein n=1 Tax=Massilia agrisoli TaxID=2892444 RepID=A0ABS8IPC0_9BURK|nr:DUF29 domain-containing protein [Massilia agrisoli]MCC6070266.1 DUF29 domain-containing protein [Massilia agrisoli]